MIEQAIHKINPKAEFIINGEDIDNIEWVNGTEPISKSDIEAQYPVVELEIALYHLREERNVLLAETDFYALSDVTMSDEMKTYRQNLRDITEGLDTVDKVKAVTMPTKP